MTLQTIADLTGVSVSTVSRVLNKVDNAASPETAHRIEAAAERLGYVPNAQAAALRTGASKVVGLIVADIANPFFATIATTLEQSLLERGYGLLVANTGNNTDLERRYVTTMAQNRVETLVVAPTSNDPRHLDEARRLGIRILLIDSRVDGVEVDCVLVDDETSIRKAVDHLTSLGHRQIGYISGHQRILSDLDRLRGYTRGLAAAGIEGDSELVIRSDFTELGGFRAAARLMALAEPPTAIVASNNFMATGVLRYARANGICIPEALSLVSFDDLDWYDLVTPRITALTQPIEAIGKLVSDLVSNTDDTAPGVPYVLPTSLTLRDSTAPPRHPTSSDKEA
ncbi:LacI family DNA-binding transcriptional regulator [Microbacterium sp. Mu-80]|uniref:LacI family DNA-binding transcriptional regulator n=1 Tax=Microbacterium bandirmense TaxID=3122050 RepID=A0ABU8LG41_9MICO